MATETKPSRARLPRPWRFSLRTLLLAMTVFAVWFGMLRNAAVKQREAVELLRRYGAQIRYEHELDAEGYPLKSPPAIPGPRWLREWLGDDYFVRAAWIRMDNRRSGQRQPREDVLALGDAELSKLADLPYLRDIGLFNVPLSDETMQKLGHLKRLEVFVLLDTKVTDASLPTIGRFWRLRDLMIVEVGDGNRRYRISTSITDAGVRSLIGLKNLERLFLEGMQLTDASAALMPRFPKLAWLGIESSLITDKGLEWIGKVSTLTTLDIEYMRITDKGVAHLRNLNNLERLFMRDTLVTDEGLEHLGGLLNLESLSMTNTAIGDAGLVHLASLKQLESLGLSRTRVTDEGMKHLARLPKLASLYLVGTGITDAGLEHLAALPLKTLEISQTQVTTDGVLNFRSAAITDVSGAGIRQRTNPRPSVDDPASESASEDDARQTPHTQE